MPRHAIRILSLAAGCWAAIAAAQPVLGPAPAVPDPEPSEMRERFVSAGGVFFGALARCDRPGIDRAAAELRRLAALARRQARDLKAAGVVATFSPEAARATADYATAQVARTDRFAKDTTYCPEPPPFPRVAPTVLERIDPLVVQRREARYRCDRAEVARLDAEIRGLAAQAEAQLIAARDPRQVTGISIDRAEMERSEVRGMILPYLRPVAKDCARRDVAGAATASPRDTAAQAPICAAVIATQLASGAATCRCTGLAPRLMTWGSGPYSSDSALCNAAAHAGVVPPSGIGPVRLAPRAEPATMTGSSRNGITSHDYHRPLAAVDLSAGESER